MPQDWQFEPETFFPYIFYKIDGLFSKVKSLKSARQESKTLQIKKTVQISSVSLLIPHETRNKCTEFKSKIFDK